jgi:hypothetical protein
MSPIGLSVLATGLSLGLALLVGLRGEVWVHAYGDIDAGASPSDPMAWLSLMWGLATLVAFAAMFMLRRGRRRLGACCALAAAAFGLTAALTAGYVADSRVVAMLWQNETALADPTKRQALALVWLIALVPLATAAGLAFQPIRASVDERRRFSGGIITAFGGAVAVVGAFLPWVDIHDPYSAIIVRNAFELGGLRLGADPRFSADGLVVVILGLVAVSIGVVVAARASVPRFIRWSPIIAGVCLAIASAARFGSIHGFATRLTAAFPDVSGSLGIGWWAALSGALLIIAGGLVAKSKPTATEAHSAGVHATSSPA